MYPTRRFSIRHPKMFRFSGVYSEKICNFLSCKRSKIGTFLDAGWRCARRGFLRGHAFSECPLKSASFSSFLAETRKEHYRTLISLKMLRGGFYPPLRFSSVSLSASQPRCADKGSRHAGAVHGSLPGDTSPAKASDSLPESVSAHEPGL